MICAVLSCVVLCRVALRNRSILCVFMYVFFCLLSYLCVECVYIHTYVYVCVCVV
jgi:hypothetical protein